VRFPHRGTINHRPSWKRPRRFSTTYRPRNRSRVISASRLSALINCPTSGSHRADFLLAAGIRRWILSDISFWASSEASRFRAEDETDARHSQRAQLRGRCENNVISYQLCVYIPDGARLMQLRSRSSLYSPLSGREFHGRGIITKRDECPCVRTGVLKSRHPTAAS